MGKRKFELVSFVALLLVLGPIGAFFSGIWSWWPGTNVGFDRAAVRTGAVNYRRLVDTVVNLVDSFVPTAVNAPIMTTECGDEAIFDCSRAGLVVHKS